MSQTQIALWSLDAILWTAIVVAWWLGLKKKKSANSKWMLRFHWLYLRLSGRTNQSQNEYLFTRLNYPNSSPPVSSSMARKIYIGPGKTEIVGNLTITNPYTDKVIVLTLAGQSIDWDEIPYQRPKLSERITHPVLGYRAFYIRLSGRRWDVMGRLVAQNVRLCAINMQFGDWQPGVNQATHYGEVDYKMALPAWKNDPDAKHVAPESGCMCGFWSLHRIDQAIAKVGWPSHDDFTHIPVVGLIQGWGRVQEHADGYRFQYASLISLSVIDPAGHVTGVAFDFAEDTARGICRVFDVPYTNRWQDLVSLKDAEEAKLRA